MSVDDWGDPGGWAEEDGAALPATASRTVARRLVDVEPQEVRWLWQDRIPAGMLSEMCGDPGEGKSHVTLALATAITLGTPLPGDPVALRRRPGHVLLVAMEDSPEHVIRPRLDRMGADLTRVTILDGIRDPDGGEPVPLDLSRPDHRLELRALVEELGVELIVVDPITAHLGGTNEWKDSEVRAVLAPLARMAQETGAAVLLVRHLRKSDSSRAIYRAGGSIAFTASVRSSLMVGRPEGEDHRRALVRPKGNLSPEPPAVGYRLDESGFGWCEGGNWTAADLLGGDRSSEDRSALEEAKDFLREALDCQPRPAAELRRVAEADGISWRTLQRARRDLGVEVRREGFPASSVWSRQSCQAPVAPLVGGDTGATDKTHAGEGIAAPGPRQSRQDSLYGENGATGAGDGPEPGPDPPPPSTCADCDRPVAPDPMFSVLRCVPCGIAAGREETARLGAAHRSLTAPTTPPTPGGPHA